MTDSVAVVVVDVDVVTVRRSTSNRIQRLFRFAGRRFHLRLIKHPIKVGVSAGNSNLPHRQQSLQQELQQQQLLQHQQLVQHQQSLRQQQPLNQPLLRQQQLL